MRSASFRSTTGPCSRRRLPARRRAPSSRTCCCTASASPRPRCTRVCGCAGRPRSDPASSSATGGCPPRLRRATTTRRRWPPCRYRSPASTSSTARRVPGWPTRRAVVATLPPDGIAPPGGIELRILLSTGSEREHGSIELIKKLLDGIGDAFYAYARCGSRRDRARARSRAQAGPGRDDACC